MKVKKVTVKNAAALVISGVASIGIGILVGHGIKAIKPPDLGKIQNILTIIGGMALSGMAADAADRYIETSVSSTLDIAETLYCTTFESDDKIDLSMENFEIEEQEDAE